MAAKQGTPSEPDDGVPFTNGAPITALVRFLDLMTTSDIDAMPKSRIDEALALTHEILKDESKNDTVREYQTVLEQLSAQRAAEAAAESDSDDSAQPKGEGEKDDGEGKASSSGSGSDDDDSDDSDDSGDDGGGGHYKK